MDISRTIQVSQYQNVSIVDFIQAKDDGGGGDNKGDKMCTKLQSDHHHQQTNTQLFTDQMALLLPKQQY